MLKHSCWKILTNELHAQLRYSKFGLQRCTALLRLIRNLLLTKRDAKYAEGVIARKQERNRLRQIKELSKQDLAISSEHLIPIPDPEAIWKATDVTWQEEERKKTKKTKSQVYNEDEIRM